MDLQLVRIVILLLSRISTVDALFVSQGELVFNGGYFDLRVPRCPRCHKEHWYGPSGDIDQYGIYRTQRQPHCDLEKWLDYFDETQITVHRTSHYYLLNGGSGGPCSSVAKEDTILEWGSKWQNHSFAELWESDLAYCISIVKTSKIKIPATPSMSRELINAAFFKEFLLDKMESRESRIRLECVYISNHQDRSGNMRGSTNCQPGARSELLQINYPSHREQWIAETGCRWPSTCCVEGCHNPPVNGAHVFLTGKVAAHIVPMCRSCNNPYVYLLDLNSNSEYTHFPMILKQNIWCLKVNDVHISQHQDTKKEKKRDSEAAPCALEGGDTVVLWGKYRRDFPFEDV